MRISEQELKEFEGCQITWSQNDHRMAEVNAAKVRELRREGGWTQLDLAREAGLSDKLVTMIEGGNSPRHLRVAIRLARALGCETWEIVKQAD